MTLPWEPTWAPDSRPRKGVGWYDRHRETGIRRPPGCPQLAVTATADKDRALEAIAQALLARQGEVLSANAADLEAGRQAGLSQALLDRLALSEQRIAGIVEGVRQVAALPDPVGEETRRDTLKSGLVLTRRRVPLGVIGIIYEARPNVTVDAAVLCLKAGNAVILRGGKEAYRSNTALMAIMRDAVEAAGLPRDSLALVADTSRSSASELMNLTEYLDVLIPRRGGGTHPLGHRQRPGAGDPHRRGGVPHLCGQRC